MELERWRRREVLSGAEAKRSQRVCGDGGHGLLTLVRAVTGWARFQGEDWRRGRDQEDARPDSFGTVAAVLLNLIVLVL